MHFIVIAGMKIKMVVKNHLICLNILLFTIQGVLSNLCESNKYSSPFANYHRLVGGADSYNSWASKCQGIFLLSVLNYCRLACSYFIIKSMFRSRQWMECCKSR